MIKNAYLESEIMQIWSQTGHLFAVCLFTAKWDSFFGDERFFDNRIAQYKSFKRKGDVM